MYDFVLKIATALEGFFHSKFLSVFFVSTFPVVEVRGGIPLGLTLNMPPWAAYLSACLAGLIIVPIILLLLKKVIALMCKSKRFGKFGAALDNYFNERAKKVEEGNIVRKRSDTALKYLALFLFVAAPLPLTGFWTGSALAVFMNLNVWKAYITITLGNLTAGGLVLLISLVLGDKSYIITTVFFILLPLVIGLMIFKMLRDKNKRAAAATAESAVSESISADTAAELPTDDAED